jgi:D-ribose pyranose/furanose isomerase RbsD
MGVSWQGVNQGLIGVAVEVIPHSELKERSQNVKTIVRTGDFTAWGNVMLVSGPGDRWKLEKPIEEKS